MQHFAIIGLGRFGARLAANLAKAGHEVLAIDIDIARVDALRDHVSLAIALDATDEQALKDHDVHKVDVAIIGVGENFEATILATVLLKQLEVKRVIARAGTETMATVLRRVGADDVVNPEDEAADQWCNRLVSPAFLSQHTFSPGYSVVDVLTPDDWIGKSLTELNVRAETGVMIIGVKRRTDKDDEARVEPIAPDKVLEPGQTLVMAGPVETLEKFAKA